MEEILLEWFLCMAPRVLSAVSIPLRVSFLLITSFALSCSCLLSLFFYYLYALRDAILLAGTATPWVHDGPLGRVRLRTGTLL